jgi:PIN domain nuclease of toxin-antitoxin system
MARYLLDTNIVLFSSHDLKELDRNVLDTLDDYNNRFYVSTVSIPTLVVALK